MLLFGSVYLKLVFVGSKCYTPAATSASQEASQKKAVLDPSLAALSQTDLQQGPWVAPVNRTVQEHCSYMPPAWLIFKKKRSVSSSSYNSAAKGTLMLVLSIGMYL